MSRRVIIVGDVPIASVRPVSPDDVVVVAEKDDGYTIEILREDPGPRNRAERRAAARKR